MKPFITAFILGIVVSACGGGPSSALRTTDVLQFRVVLDEDPLAIKSNMPDGSEIIIGDIMLTDQGILRTSVEPNVEEGFDVELTLSDREQARLTEFWYGRRSNRKLVIVKDGQPWRIIDGKSLVKENRILLKNVAPTEEGATELADRIVLWKQKKKKPKTD